MDPKNIYIGNYLLKKLNIYVNFVRNKFFRFSLLVYLLKDFYKALISNIVQKK